MQRILFFLFTFCFPGILFAQNVNGLLFDATNSATRNPSAAFEINANTNTVGVPLYGGFLMPKVALTAANDAATIAGAEATGLMVYNDGTAGLTPAGFYYWNGSAWMQLATASGGTGYIQNQSTAVQNPGTFWIQGVGRVGDGTAALPGLSFNTSSNTGMYLPAANTLGLSTSGIERMRVAPAGSVSINTTSTPGTLSVNGNAVIGAGLTSRASIGATISSSDAFAYAANSDVGDGHRMLSIVNENATAGNMAILSMRVNPAGGANNQMLDMKLVNPNDGTSKLHFSFGPAVAFTDRFSFLSSGNMGIGSTSPNGILTIERSNTTYNAPTTFLQLIKRGDVNASNNDGAGTRIDFLSEDVDGNAFSIGYMDVVLQDPNYNGIGRSGDIIFSTLRSWNGSNAPLERVRIQSDGNVGIGTTAPGAKLHLGAFDDNHLLLTSSNNTYGWRIDTRDNSAGSVPFRIFKRTAGADTEVLTILNQNGNVGIGSNLPNQKLEVAGNTRITGLGGSSTKLVQTNNSGDLAVSSIDPSTVMTTTNISGTLNYVSKFTSANSIGNSQIFDDATNVGISSATPNQKLIIGGNGGIGFFGTGLNSADKKLYSPGDGDLEWMTHSSAGVHGFAVSHQGTKAVYLNISGDSYFNGGNLGIGMTVPGHRLGVQRAAGATSVSDVYYTDGTQWMMENSNSTGGAWNPMATAGDHTIIFSNGTLETGGLLIGQWSNSSKGIRMDATGNVGIGIAAPVNKLDVSGQVGVGYRTPAASQTTTPNWGNAAIFSGGTGMIAGYDSDNSDPIWMARYNAASNASELRVNVGDDPTYVDDKFVVGAMSGFANFNTGGVWTPYFTVQMNGNVGVGTTSPASLFSVGATSQFRVNSSGQIATISGYSPPVAAIRITPNMHLNAMGGSAVIINWDNGTTGATQTFRIGNGASSDVFYVYADGQAFTTNWWRSLGNTGWLNQSWGGGWYMTDATFLRTYGDKTILASGGIAATGTAPASSLYGAVGRINANYDNVAGGGIMVADDGGFFDYNDAYVTFNGSTGLKIAGNSGAGSSGLLYVQGNVGIGTATPAAPLHVNGDARFGCRAGFWAIADGRICMETTLRGSTDMHSAISTCTNLAPGCRVCEHNDFQQACGAGVGNPYGSGSGWYGDHGVASGGNWDDEFGTWNNNGCAANNDGPAEHATAVSRNFKCCY